MPNPKRPPLHADKHADHEVIDPMERDASRPVPAPQHGAMADPPPVPPQKPLPFDCCESGCDRCVYDVHADEVAHYLSLLAAWRKRNPGGQPGED